MQELFISLGSNLGRRRLYLEKARALISSEIGTLIKCSSLYETKPVGFESQHLFLNQVVQVQCQLPPYELLEKTQEIEKALGRDRKSSHGIHFDRTCDIDIILYGELIIEDEQLQIPHPRFRERLFVLEPLAEIAPDAVDPVTQKTVQQLLWDVL